MHPKIQFKTCWLFGYFHFTFNGIMIIMLKTETNHFAWPDMQPVILLKGMCLLMSSCNLYLIFLRCILWFTPSTHIYPHTKKITHKNCCTHTHTQTHRLTLPLYKTQQSSKICTTSFCSQTKSLKANRCFHVIIASYRSSLPLIRLYFLTQMLRSSIYQMYQKEQPGSWRDEWALKIPVGLGDET